MKKFLLPTTIILLTWILMTTNPSDISLLKLLFVLMLVSATIILSLWSIIEKLEGYRKSILIFVGGIFWAATMLRSVSAASVKEIAFLGFAALLIYVYSRQNFFTDSKV